MQDKQDRELFVIEQRPKIGTQILDPSLPSQLIQGDNKNSIAKQEVRLEISSKSNTLKIDQTLENYIVKGKNLFKLMPKYQKHQTINLSLPTLLIKKVPKHFNGVKSIWQNIIGYCKRQLYFSQGFIYCMEKINSGYLIHGVWVLDDLFKVFYDRQTTEVRMVFLKGSITKMKDFKIVDKQIFFVRLRDELIKIGRSLM